MNNRGNGTRSAGRPGTVGSIIAQWQHSVEWEALRERSRTQYTRYIDPLFEALQHAAIRNVQRRQLMAIRDAVARTRGHSAARMFCLATGVFFAWCVDRSIIDYSPATKMRKHLKSGPGFAAWTEEQARTALRLLPEPCRRIVLLGMHTAQRRGDLCKMRWSDYDGTHIRVVQEKARERAPVVLDVPVSAELKAELDVWKRNVTTLTILATADGLPWRAEYMTQVLSDELVKAGLPKGLNVHGLRKLQSARLAQAECTVHQIQAITGHKTLAMIELYTRSVNQKQLADAAVLRLGSLLPDRKGTRKA